MKAPSSAPHPNCIMSVSETYKRIYAEVRKVPRGKVATYGQIARLAGFPRHARLVGYALNALPDDTRLPWHRIVNAEGRVSPRKNSDGDLVQRLLLEAEGIVFDARGAVTLTTVLWTPRPSTPKI